MPRKVYLEDIPLDEARRRYDEALAAAGALQPIESERVPVGEALGRVTAGPVWAAISNPHYHGAAMDGAAVRAEETLGASEATPIRLRVGKQAEWVDTGDPLPAGMNAVIMVEHIQTHGEEIEIMAPVAPWQHVRSMGEDIVATELVLPDGKTLTPVDLGAAAASGHPYLEVRRKPRIAIFPTGTELVEPGTNVKPGDIVEFNSLMLAGQVQSGAASRSASRSPPTSTRSLKSGSRPPSMSTTWCWSTPVRRPARKITRPGSSASSARSRSTAARSGPATRSSWA